MTVWRAPPGAVRSEALAKPKLFEVRNAHRTPLDLAWSKQSHSGNVTDCVLAATVVEVGSSAHVLPTVGGGTTSAASQAYALSIPLTGGRVAPNRHGAGVPVAVRRDQTPATSTAPGRLSMAGSI